MHVTICKKNLDSVFVILAKYQDPDKTLQSCASVQGLQCKQHAPATV